jgi:hypothetical protein
MRRIAPHAAAHYDTPRRLSTHRCGPSLGRTAVVHRLPPSTTESAGPYCAKYVLDVATEMNCFRRNVRLCLARRPPSPHRHRNSWVSRVRWAWATRVTCGMTHFGRRLGRPGCRTPTCHASPRRPLAATSQYVLHTTTFTYLVPPDPSVNKSLGTKCARPISRQLSVRISPRWLSAPYRPFQWLRHGRSNRPT